MTMKAIKQAKLREILDAYNREEISYSRMNEMLNELADKYAVDVMKWTLVNCWLHNNEYWELVTKHGHVLITEEELLKIYKKENKL